MNQIIADGVEEITVIGGIVRVDLFTHSPGRKGADGRPPREHVARLCLPPEAFVQTYATLHKVVQQLREKGLIQNKAADAAAETAAVATTAATTSAAPPQAAAKAPAARVQRARGSANF
jgi:hypothetical protein